MNEESLWIVAIIVSLIVYGSLVDNILDFHWAVIILIFLILAVSESWFFLNLIGAVKRGVRE